MEEKTPPQEIQAQEIVLKVLKVISIYQRLYLPAMFKELEALIFP